MKQPRFLGHGIWLNEEPTEVWHFPEGMSKEQFFEMVDSMKVKNEEIVIRCYNCDQEIETVSFVGDPQEVCYSVLCRDCQRQICENIHSNRKLEPKYDEVELKFCPCKECSND